MGLRRPLGPPRPRGETRPLPAGARAGRGGGGRREGPTRAHLWLPRQRPPRVEVALPRPAEGVAALTVVAEGPQIQLRRLLGRASRPGPRGAARAVRAAAAAGAGAGGLERAADAGVPGARAQRPQRLLPPEAPALLHRGPQVPVVVPSPGPRGGAGGTRGHHAAAGAPPRFSRAAAERGRRGCGALSTRRLPAPPPPLTGWTPAPGPRFPGSTTAPSAARQPAEEGPRRPRTLGRSGLRARPTLPGQPGGVPARGARGPRRGGGGAAG